MDGWLLVLLSTDTTPPLLVACLVFPTLRLQFSFLVSRDDVAVAALAKTPPTRRPLSIVFASTVVLSTLISPLGIIPSHTPFRVFLRLHRFIFTVFLLLALPARSAFFFLFLSFSISYYFSVTFAHAQRHDVLSAVSPTHPDALQSLQSSEPACRKFQHST